MKKTRNIIVESGLILGVYFLFYITGIGCPIKFFTGISCGGCGMTRAWLSAVHLDFKNAFYYHPLMPLPPIYIFVFFLRNKLGKCLYKSITVLFAALFVVVYVIRLLDPHDTIVVFNPRDGIILKTIHFIGRWIN